MSLSFNNRSVSSRRHARPGRHRVRQLESVCADTSSADVTIIMVGDRGSQSFSPNPTTMRVGQTVAWKNNDTIAHDATQDACALLDTGTVSAGATSAPLTMSTAGTFTYHCTIHPGMVGTLVVQ